MHPGYDGNSRVRTDLLGRIPAGNQIGTVAADGAHDTRRRHNAIITRQTAVFPARRNGGLPTEDRLAAHARPNTLRETRYHGRTFGKRWNGCHARSRVAARSRCLNGFGARIAASAPNHQTIEINIRIALMSRISSLGTAEMVRLA